MSTPVIQVTNLSKRYRLGATLNHDTLRDYLTYGFNSLWHRLRGNGHFDHHADRLAAMSSSSGAAASSESSSFGADGEFWALKDVSFEVRQGEIVGIIGRNGAGKSTLLKILSRITEPTGGEVRMHGRVASLLEVGTGFHPELSGRENIYLNGAILGMSRAEIKAKFDEIVAFAEIDKFIDTPVKRYSSGMYVRLAFAVAAHLEPEILLVDEVLAVGDASFQKKCLGKMGDVAREGRTVLFVSHSMPSVMRLCNRVFLLDHGKLVAKGSPHQVISAYLQSELGSPAKRVWDDIHTAPGGSIARLRAVWVHTETDQIAEVVDIRHPVGIDVEYWNLKEGAKLVPNLHFFNEEGICIFISTNNTNEWYNQPHPLGIFKSTCWIPGNFLSEGLITVTAAVSTINPTVACAVERDVVSFQVEDRSEGDGARGLIATDFPGVVRPLFTWKMNFEPIGLNGFDSP